VRRLARFTTVGLLATLIDVGLFTVSHVRLGVPTLAANTASSSAGIVGSYILHRRWTYADRPRKAIRVQFAQFASISLIALVVNNVLVLLLAPKLGALFTTSARAAWLPNDLLAKRCATGVSMCWNFLANNLWTFHCMEQGVGK
jgi:putative flippase GtrA